MICVLIRCLISNSVRYLAKAVAWMPQRRTYERIGITGQQFDRKGFESIGPGDDWVT